MSATACLLTVFGTMFVLWRVARAYLTLERMRLEGLESTYSVFNTSADLLIKHFKPAYPGELLLDIAFFNLAINDDKACSRIAYMVLSKTIGRRRYIARGESDAKVIEFLDKNKEIGSLYTKMVAAGMAAACFKPPFVGLFVFNRVITYLDSISRQGKTTEAEIIASQARAHIRVRPFVPATA